MADTHRVQPYYSPPTSRARFSPERLLTPPLPTLFPLEEKEYQAARPSYLDKDPSSSDKDEDKEGEPTYNYTRTVRKPDGEAGKPKSGGYSLKEYLKWDNAKYDAVKVLSHLVETILS